MTRSKKIANRPLEHTCGPEVTCLCFGNPSFLFFWVGYVPWVCWNFLRNKLLLEVAWFYFACQSRRDFSRSLNWHGCQGRHVCNGWLIEGGWNHMKSNVNMVYMHIWDASFGLTFPTDFEPTVYHDCNPESRFCKKHHSNASRTFIKPGTKAGHLLRVFFLSVAFWTRVAPGDLHVLVAPVKLSGV